MDAATATAAAQEFRAAFEKARDAGAIEEAKGAAVAYYRQRATEGGTQETCAQELGISQSTLSKWHLRDAPGAASADRVAQPRELDGEGEALRAELDGLGQTGPSRRYPEDLKRRIVSWVTTRRAAGMSSTEVEEGLGIPWTSLSKWMRERPTRPSSPTPKLKPVTVVETRTSVRPILKTPGGFVVEGLDIEGMAVLLRRLG